MPFHPSTITFDEVPIPKAKRPGAASAELRPLVAHVHAAKHLALCLGTGVGEEGYQSELDEAALRQEGITPEMTESLLPAVLDISTKLLHNQTPA